MLVELTAQLFDMWLDEDLTVNGKTDLMVLLTTTTSSLSAADIKQILFSPHQRTSDNVFTILKVTDEFFNMDVDAASVALFVTTSVHHIHAKIFTVIKDELPPTDNMWLTLLKSVIHHLTRDEQRLGCELLSAIWKFMGASSQQQFSMGVVEHVV